RGQALAAARLADEAQHLAAPQRKADAIDRLDDAAPQEEMRLQLADIEGGIAARRSSVPLLIFLVTPAKAGVQGNRRSVWPLDSRFRGNDVIRPHGGHSCRSLGSSRSRSQSPNTLTDRTRRVIAMPGISDTHHASAMRPRPSNTISPQVGVGGGMPAPRKLNDDLGA